MMKQQFGTICLAMTITFLALSGGYAYATERPLRPLTPEMAAKKEMVRKQHQQRVTNEQRKSAAEALKAERIKIYNAKHGLTPATPENK